MTTPLPSAPADLAAVDRLLAEAGLPPTDADCAASDFLVVGSPDVVGCVGVVAYGPNGLLRSLAVASEARGRGVGGRLVEAAEALAHARGLRALYLLTTTAAPFFAARGYAPVERAAVPEAVRRSPEFAGACPASAATMAKRLLA